MEREHDRRDRAVSTLSRRSALAGGAALLTAGGTLVVVGEPASAAVTVDDLAVSDAEFTRETMTPRVDVTAGYQYDAGTEPVGTVRLELLVGETVVDSEDLVTDATSAASETTLSGLLTDSERWAVSDFAPKVASAVTWDVTIGLRLAVLTSGGDVIVKDSASDTATVTVRHPQRSKYVAEVGGVGQIVASDN